MAVGIFYKWEDHNHGLEHKCGTCATVLSSPRAKKTCFGVHEEVCPAYHKTLHFVGASHNCTACANTTKAHSKRHHEIARIIQAIHRLDGSSGTDRPIRTTKRKSKKKDDSKTDPSEVSDVHPSQVDLEPEAEWDSNESTLNNDDDDDIEERKKYWSGSIESPDARKAAKAQRKAEKHQVLFDVITQEGLTMVEEALHPQAESQAGTDSKGQGLANNRTIDENIAFNSNTFKWGTLRQKKIARLESGKQKPTTPEQDNKILNLIFAQLGIKTNLSKANKERRSLDSKLRATILRDLVAYENDQAETMKRMAGYWRYVNKMTYNHMVRNNELWDWATGEKLPEITEEAELDVVEEEGRNAEAGIQGAEMQGFVPENWHDPGFEQPAGVAAPALAPQIDMSSGNRKIVELGQEVKSISDQTNISKLSSSIKCLHVQTLNSNVTSPISSNDACEWLRAETGEHKKGHLEILNGSSPMISNPKSPYEVGFQGVRDTRIFGKAIRNASPPPPNTPRTTQQPLKTLSSTPLSSQNGRDPCNRFGTLDHEVPAPCDEVKKKADPMLIKSTIRIPAKPIVKTLVIHEDDGEDDWKTVVGQVKKSKKGKTKGGNAVTLRERAAVNVHARKFAGGKSFAAVVKRGS